MEYLENEVKILNVDPQALATRFTQIGAAKVYEGIRTITTFDYVDRRLGKERQEVRLTEEGKLKLSYETQTPRGKESVKLFVSRKEEAAEFLRRLGLVPVTEAHARRTSYEWEGADFDIDEFPGIPPFLEIDPGTHPQEEILALLDLGQHERLRASTKDIFRHYGKEYDESFAISRASTGRAAVHR